MLKLVICDWNRTLFKDYFEETFCRQVFKTVAVKALMNFNISEIISLVFVAFKAKRLLWRARQGKSTDSIYELVELLNKDLFSKIAKNDLNKLLKAYVQAGMAKLDLRILKPLQSLKERKNIRLGIISSGYYQGIKQILENSGFTFDFIIADDFLTIGPQGMRFELKVNSNKGDILKQIIKEEKVESENVMYIGDDSRDENCFPEVGFPVAAFLATDENKRRFKKAYNAFVPKTQRGFEKYLNKA
jgi:phosphoglycolate phosphatase-like HAD superfamily hydrolase